VDKEECYQKRKEKRSGSNMAKKRKKFAEGSNEEPLVVTPEEMDKLLNPPEIKIPKIPSNKEIADVSKSVEDYKKKEKEEPKPQMRCAKSKDGLQFRCKKGGLIFKGKPKIALRGWK